ncbi:hypothetical protein BDZ45DRAFT_69336 [Acephala macrosclerotiorum]|nr:hypothetical protein BDZ45DRAFT_69336 [Acephala macrosclerotiorum]
MRVCAVSQAFAPLARSLLCTPIRATLPNPLSSHVAPAEKFLLSSNQSFFTGTNITNCCEPHLSFRRLPRDQSPGFAVINVPWVEQSDPCNRPSSHCIPPHPRSAIRRYCRGLCWYRDIQPPPYKNSSFLCCAIRGSCIITTKQLLRLTTRQSNTINHHEPEKNEVVV